MVRKGSPIRVRQRAYRFAGFSHRALIGSGDRGTPEEHGSAGSRGERLLGPSTHPPRPARRTSSFRVMRLLPFSVSAFFAGDSRALPAGPSRVSTLACRTSPAVALASSCWQRRRPPRLLRSTRVLPLPPHRPRRPVPDKSAAVGAAITSGAACGWSSPTSCALPRQGGACAASRPLFRGSAAAGIRPPRE
jgi:hypothetical protein